MSDTNDNRKSSQVRDIPSRRVILNDPSQLPPDYSTTPGGTIFSTTPGGTRIIYDRAFLLQMRNSPIARTPPKNLPYIPGVTSPPDRLKENGEVPLKTEKTKNSGDTGTVNPDEPQFQMDI